MSNSIPIPTYLLELDIIERPHQEQSHPQDYNPVGRDPSNDSSYHSTILKFEKIVMEFTPIRVASNIPSTIT